MKFLLLLSVAVSLSSAVTLLKHTCKTDTDCGSNQCCYIEPEFQIMSKRLAQLPSQHHNRTTGYCENYQAQGTACSPFDKLNGHCSCPDNLTCRFVPAPSIVRRKLYFPGPGQYLCAPPLPKQ